MEWSAGILAGGRSIRFGREKALVPWRGKPLLRHVLDRIGRRHWEGVRMPGLKGHGVLGLCLRRRNRFPAEVRRTEMQLALLVQWRAPAP